MSHATGITSSAKVKSFPLREALVVTSSPYRHLFPSLLHADAPVYLDSAASCQLPQSVIDAMSHYYQHGHANINRSSHRWARQTTQACDEARSLVANFIGAKPENIIWRSGTTDAINMVAQGLKHRFKAGDEIWISQMEHHANLVTWQQLAQQTKACLKVIPVLANGDLNLDYFREHISTRCKFLALCHVSNTTGCINPIAGVIRLAKEYGARVLIDGAQAVAHLSVNVTQLGCDYYVFSGHKLYGPTGIGVLYGSDEALHALAPSHFGGEMVSEVSLDKSTWASLPYRLEAGTPNILGIIGLAAALRFLLAHDEKARHAHERGLLNYALSRLKSHAHVTLLAQPMLQTAVIAFAINNVHPHDAASIFDQANIALRCGHHCAMPLSKQLSAEGSLRLSLGIYNQHSDIDALINAIDQIVELFADD